MLSESTRATLWLKIFGFFKVPLIWQSGVSVVEISDEHIEIKIPLKKNTKNHLNSMYIGALAIGADVAGGALAVFQIKKLGANVSFVFKDLHADFLKRADGDTHFRCNAGAALTKLVNKAVETGERVNETVEIVATVPSKYGQEPVAKFTTTLSLKKV